MPIITRNPETLFPPYGNCSHTSEVKGNTYFLSTGLVDTFPVKPNMPRPFEAQGKLV